MSTQKSEILFCQTNICSPPRDFYTEVIKKEFEKHNTFKQNYDVDLHKRENFGLHLATNLYAAASVLKKVPMASLCFIGSYIIPFNIFLTGFSC